MVENISLPEEVEKTMDRRTSMGVIGDMNRYTQYQAAESMREAAGNPGNSGMGMGIGMGAGAAMAQMFAQTLNQAQQQPQQQAQPAQGGSFCPECGTPLQPGAKFCPNCGQKQ